MKIIIPGPPIPQGRPRLSKWGICDPNWKEKKEIRAYLNEYYGDTPFLQHPRLSFVFQMPIPKSMSKADYLDAMTGLKKHEKKPDNDNIMKLYMDCLDGIIYSADQKVQIGFCVKLYHPFPKTIIIANETEPILTQHEVDPGTWGLLTSSESVQQTPDEMISRDDFYTPTDLNDSQSYKPSYPLFGDLYKVVLRPFQIIREQVCMAFQKTALSV